MELSTDRQIGFGIGPIPYSSILTFCAHKDLGAEETEDLFYIIRAMDAAFLKMSNKHAKISKSSGNGKRTEKAK